MRLVFLHELKRGMRYVRDDGATFEVLADASDKFCSFGRLHVSVLVRRTDLDNLPCGFGVHPSFKEPKRISDFAHRAVLLLDDGAANVGIFTRDDVLELTQPSDVSIKGDK